MRGEASLPLGAFGDVLRENLNGHGPAEARGVGLVDLPYTASYANVFAFSLKISASSSPLKPVSGKPFFSPITRCAT